MSTAYIILAIAVSAAVTFMLRALPFAAFRGEKTMPAWLERLGQTLPSAIMAVLVVYCLKGAAADFVGTGVPQLIAVAVVAVSYKLRHSTFLSILLGTGAYMALLRFMQHQNVNRVTPG